MNAVSLMDVSTIRTTPSHCIGSTDLKELDES